MAPPRGLCPAGSPPKNNSSMTGFVYILRSLKDNKKYIGSTVDLERRLDEHNKGKVFSTKYRIPFKLEMYQKFNTIEEAAYLEKKYKNGHGFLERAIKRGDLIYNNRNSSAG